MGHNITVYSATLDSATENNATIDSATSKWEHKIMKS